MDKKQRDAFDKILDDLKCTRIALLNIESSIEEEIEELKQVINDLKEDTNDASAER